MQNVDLNVELPDGWTQSAPGRMATFLDPVSGGIIDQQLVSGKWFVIPQDDDLLDLSDQLFDSRAEAFAALAQAVAAKGV